MSKPELSGPPELYYNETEARKYDTNSHVYEIQRTMAQRAIDLLELPDTMSGIILDVGCGTGMSGEVITENGHDWIGVDVSPSMLEVAVKMREVEGDLIQRDIGCGLPFKAGCFDGVISISAIQWLCHSNSNDQKPRKRLLRFFQTLYGCMTRGSKAVFQYYPESEAQANLIKGAAVKAGFSGGTVVDFPECQRRKKYYLVLNTGGHQNLPKALSDNIEVEDEVDQCDVVESRSFNLNGNRKRKAPKGSKDYIIAKKERMRKQGKEVCHDSNLDCVESIIQTNFPITQRLSTSNQSMFYTKGNVSHNQEYVENETATVKSDNTTKCYKTEELQSKLDGEVSNHCDKGSPSNLFYLNKRISTDIRSISTRSFHSSSESTISTDFGMEAGKEAAARACALAHVYDGCKIGVGSGRELKDIKCVPTSFLTKKWLQEANLPVYSLENLSHLDICIDGADEVDSKLNCIKGGGGCLTQEKIVQSCSKKFFVIADCSKKSDCLGERWKSIPLEVIPFGYVPLMNKIEETLGGKCLLRMAHKKCGPVITDNNCYVVDWHFPSSFIKSDHDWHSTNNFLINIPGVVETGLFLNVTEEAFFATIDGKVECIKKN
ncbi:Ribosome biogenesis methyltransferase WBSCR22 [Strongyloides ratti]|uniref:ribose-5-phosphate isomerase n=1 Tax=Strongyloides ratti TaxID=34506 RepID=A0A090MYF9_STRRB|nr:Ribosome biogenesis methyltransferase WBSCR22 [Strongyloides ratti]CEF67114.1 Ribosome biogenesis methyltransferase WBSCR22 [Strongyloides ratti]